MNLPVRACVCLSLLLAGAPAVRAQTTFTHFWNNASGDGSIANPANWDSSPSSVPGSSSVVAFGVNAPDFAGTTTTWAGLLLIGNPTLANGNLTVGFVTGQPSAPAGLVFNLNLTIDPGAGNTSLDVPMAGTGTLTKLGTGTLTLTQATAPYQTNPHTGAVAVNAGTLALAHAQALQGSTLAIGAGGAVSFSGLTSATVGALSGSGALALANDAAGAVALTAGGNGGSTTFSGVLSGAGSLTKAGAGTLTLAAANTYAGDTTVSAGTLRLGGADALPAASALTVAAGATLDLAGQSLTRGGIAGAGSIARGGGTLTLGADNVSSTLAAQVGGAGAFTKVGTGTLTLDSSASLSGPVTVAAGTLGILSSLSDAPLLNAAITLESGAALDVNVPGGTGTAYVGSLAGAGAITRSGSEQGFAVLHVGLDGASTTYAGAVADRVGLFKRGAGTLTLAGAGTIPVLNAGGGTVLLGPDRSIGTLLTNGGTLDTNGRSLAVEGASLNGGTLAFGGGSLVLTTAFESGLNSATTLSGGGGFTKAGIGEFVVYDAFSYGGATALNGGTTTLHGSNLLPAASALTVGAAGRLAFGDSSVTQTFASLAGAGAIDFAGGATLTVGGNGASTTFSGTLENGGTLAKTGAGELRFDGAGGTTALTVGGGRLSGTGTVGALTIASGGTLAPGSSPGTLTAGNTTFAGGGSYLWEINNALGTAGTNWDLLSINGGLTITASAGNPFTFWLVSLTGADAAGAVANFDPAQNATFLVAATTAGIAGFEASAFAVDTSGFANASSGTWWLGVTGNNLVLNYTAAAIPEPSTWAAVAGLLAWAGAAWRRRRRGTEERV